MRYLLCIFSGLLLGFSQAFVVGKWSEKPLDSTGLSGLLVLIGYIPVLWACINQSVKKTFWFGFLAAMVQYVVILHWLIIAMTVFGGVNLVLSTLGLLAVCAILASYTGFAFSLAQYLHRRFRWSFLWLLPLTVCSAEYVRNYVPYGGFPWGTSGYALSTVPILLQGASIVGIYGLVFYVVLVNAALLSGILSRKKNRLVSVAIASTFFLIVYGAWRLNTSHTSQAQTLKVALLQGNIEQGIKNKAYLHSHEILTRYERLQNESKKEDVDVVIWPEASYPIYLSKSPNPVLNFASSVPTTLLGTVFSERTSEGWTLYNTALVLNDRFEPTGRFDKSHLVPFGEYVPWPFKGLVQKIVPGMGAFGRGQNFIPADISKRDGSKAKAGVTICYEGVFPEISRAFVRAGAEVLINMTNDAWYGVSSAPYQHLRMYVVRAVETGRSFVRSTNTGISTWIDSRGFIHQPTSLYREDSVVAEVPLSQEKTPYVLLGDFVAYLSLMFVLAAWMVALVGKDVLVRRREQTEWILGFLGLALLVWSHGYFAEAKLHLDEAAFTKDNFLTLFGFVVTAAAWSGKPWGRSALMWTGGLVFFLSLPVAYAEGAVYLLTALSGLLVFLLARMRPQAFGMSEK